MYNNRVVCAFIPAFDEENTIAEVIQRIPEFVDAVYVVDDGSTDRTALAAKEAGAEVISHGYNRGLGETFRTIVRAAISSNVDYAVTLDGDGQFDPTGIETLIEEAVSRQADFVTASRFIDPEFYPKMSRVKFWGNRMISRLVSWIVGARFYDVSCGFRVYSREALLRLNLFGRHTYTQEVFLNLAFKRVADSRGAGAREGHARVWRF